MAEDVEGNGKLPVAPQSHHPHPAKNGSVYCMDCKVVLDQNAEYRQKELFALKDTHQVDELELRAEKANLNYIRLDGNIGCMGRG